MSDGGYIVEVSPSTGDATFTPVTVEAGGGEVSDLTDFLLARIAEDEADVLVTTLPRQQHGTPWHWRSRARVLADCEAKRRIVDWARSALEPDAVLIALALPYADHPDFNPDWRP